MAERTTQAVILAAGLGTRMRREAEQGPALSAEQRAAAASGAKAMMPLGARPFLDYVLSALADAGITDVVLVIGPQQHQLREYFTTVAPPERVRVRFAVQQEPRGTADAVLAARGVADDAPFLVLNSDNYYPVAAYSALAALGASGLIAFEAETLVHEGGIEPERVFKYALVDATDDGWLRAIREKPDVDDPLARRAERWVSMNVWSFTPVIFDACERVRPSARGELEIQEAVTIAMRDLGERFRVLPMRAGVLDLSSRADVALVAARLAGVVPRP
jgi:UDP-N-acetylglucosamine diphosphorylase / glucose-1-phosphate thymidylyltransferase / UDP-N-acetylgalactosamine diphosphorylase / glucosamine-1-phosphate N-acetyltransferase / galactosamine-1-phosphate N-acetyltransferase